MYDRPNLDEMLLAVRQHLETQVIPVAKTIHHKLYFQTLVAVNVLRVAERELSLKNAHYKAEWSRLNMLLGDEALPTDPAEWDGAMQRRNAQLCEAIRNGKHDDNRALFRTSKPVLPNN